MSICIKIVDNYSTRFWKKLGVYIWLQILTLLLVSNEESAWVDGWYIVVIQNIYNFIS